MASIVVRLQPKPRIRDPQLHLRSLCSSAGPSPAPPSNEPPASGEDPSPPLTSHIADIKARLRLSSAPPRRIPLNPPKPDVLNEPSSKVASLDEIRKNLSALRSRASPPNPAKSSSSSNISLMDLFNKNTSDNTSDGGGAKADRLSFGAIRQSFQRLPRTSGEGPGTHGRSRGTQYGLSSIGAMTERLNIQPRQNTNRSDQLPRSIFGKELEQEEGEGDKTTRESKTEFLHMYNHRQLGEKLRQLRPPERKGSFSLQELNERLVRLRKIDERQMESKSGNLFAEIRSSLSKLKDVGDANKRTINDLSFLAHLGGHFAPKYLLGEPKEHLVEKYFHPDLMSSEEKLKLELKKVRDEFKMSESDCGSARVQVAQLTTKIKHLSTVLHKKDKHSQKGLQAMVQRRRKLLKYLRRTDWDSYCFVLSKLGLRDAPDYRISAA